MTLQVMYIWCKVRGCTVSKGSITHNSPFDMVTEDAGWDLNG